jgi:hypothetical protein
VCDKFSVKCDFCCPLENDNSLAIVQRAYGRRKPVNVVFLAEDRVDEREVGADVQVFPGNPVDSCSSNSDADAPL